MTREYESDFHETLVVARPTGETPGASAGTRSDTLPQDLLVPAVKRLRILTLLFAFVFLMANFAAMLVNLVYEIANHERYEEWAWNFSSWGPGVLSIVFSLGVCASTWHRRFTPQMLMNVGLLFGAVGSYGIAFAEYWTVFTAPIDWSEALSGPGLSYVAPWMVLYAIVLPNRPRRTLLSALGAATAVPTVVGLAMNQASSTLELNAGQFFFAFVFPYVLCVLMAYAGAGVVYKLGRDVRRARELGSYQLVEQLGRGGMGEVWRAKHRLLARPAAIKLIRPEVMGAYDGEEQRVVVKRFEREAQATASMRSPHTIQLYDFGTAADGAFYYVMELLAGFDLETLIKRFGPVSPERAVHLLTQACHSLAEAHDNGLTHRDIKPANIYVCRYGREVDFVKVLDFGLVKTRHDDEDFDVMLTREHSPGGTPAFMAPEQILGNRTLDARTDIYALGCVAYWLLTGQLVFPGENAMQSMTQHVHDTPIPPSQRGEIAIPTGLENTVLACLEKAPDSRPQSADALAALLVESGVEQWSTERAHNWWRTHAPA